jgi:hypothetical protein
MLTRPVVLNANWMASISPQLAERDLLAATIATKYWYDKPTRTIKFRRYTPWEIYKAPGTSA